MRTVVHWNLCRGISTSYNPEGLRESPQNSAYYGPEVPPIFSHVELSDLGGPWIGGLGD